VAITRGVAQPLGAVAGRIDALSARLDRRRFLSMTRKLKKAPHLRELTQTDL
jgi:hypothetical protein